LLLTASDGSKVRCWDFCAAEGYT